MREVVFDYNFFFVIIIVYCVIRAA